MKLLRLILAAALLAWAGVAQAAVGFQQVQAPRAGGPPLSVSIWYPSDDPARDAAAGPYRQTVAPDGAVSGRHLPLIVLSHGSSGSPFNHYDLALTLAQAGFVVAAPLHPGDNYADSAAAGFRRDLIDRPRHLAETIAYMRTAWPARDRLDPHRLGLFGFSLGGLTALTLAGGTPDLARLPRHCARRPQAVECRFVRDQHGDQLDPDPPRVAWPAAADVAAVVVAAPAVTLLFGPHGLDHVHVPVQLWRAAKDENVPDAWNTANLRARLPTPPQEHLVPRAGHFVFSAPCPAPLAAQVPSLCSDPPGVDRAAFHAVFDRQVTAFFRAHLKPPGAAAPPAR